MSAPLRTVIARRLWPVTVGASGNSYNLPSDLLECGHRLGVASDMVGDRYPDRRRCRKCAAGQARDFEPAAVKADDAR